MKFMFPHLTSFEDATRNFEQIEAAGMFVGKGVPTFKATAGNFFFRRDGAVGTSTLIYFFNGTSWVGIL